MTTVVDTNVVAVLMLPTAANAEVAALLRGQVESAAGAGGGRANHLRPTTGPRPGGQTTKLAKKRHAD